MKSNKKILIALLGAIVVWVVAYIVFRQMPEVAADAESTSKMYATYWALIPPVVAIILALITKEVISSLLIGILTGALIYSYGNPIGMVLNTFNVMGERMSGNVNILIFLGLIGEYILSINQRIMNRPLVIEAERINFEKSEETIN